MKTFQYTLIAFLFIASNFVYAHTGLKQSLPENKSVLTTPPKNISLIFGAKVRLMKLVVIKSDEEKPQEMEVDFKPSAKLASRFIQELPLLGSGNYTVHWVSMGKDAHKIKGEFSFIVNPDYTKSQ